jgi:2-polyprenyl-3-methyl-5-hydroxy-6-metoxy-1,4-benzoquinol methylase
MHNNEIRSAPCPDCKVCGSHGVLIYQELQDRLFAAPGLWNLKQCKKTECGLMWLDPMPLEVDIHKAYHSYYTHGEDSHKKSPTEQPITMILTNILLLFLRLTPIHRERKDFNLMYLGNIKPGRLLGVGCGDGARLSRLASLGWSVEGQEVDPISAAIAAKTGIKVHLGSLENLNLPDTSYEAIVMNHVIEHVHDPVKLLMECRRILSPNGILIAVTPNIRSYGHRIFKLHWRGLEPPRHILLYCQESLRCIAQKAGFENPTTWTTAANAHHFALGSLNIIYGNNNIKLSTKTLYYFGPKLFLLVARIVQTFDKDSGEECVLMLRKGK